MSSFPSSLPVSVILIVECAILAALVWSMRLALVRGTTWLRINGGGGERIDAKRLYDYIDANSGRAGRPAYVHPTYDFARGGVTLLRTDGRSLRAVAHWPFPDEVDRDDPQWPRLRFDWSRLADRWRIAPDSLALSDVCEIVSLSALQRSARSASVGFSPNMLERLRVRVEDNGATVMYYLAVASSEDKLESIRLRLPPNVSASRLPLGNGRWSVRLSAIGPCAKPDTVLYGDYATLYLRAHRPDDAPEPPPRDTAEYDRVLPAFRWLCRGVHDREPLLVAADKFEAKSRDKRDVTPPPPPLPLPIH